MSKAGFSKVRAEETVDPAISCKLVYDWYRLNGKHSNVVSSLLNRMNITKPGTHQFHIMGVPAHVQELAIRGRITSLESLELAIVTARLLGDSAPQYETGTVTATGRFSTSPNISQIPRTK